MWRLPTAMPSPWTWPSSNSRKDSRVVKSPNGLKKPSKPSSAQLVVWITDAGSIRFPRKLAKRMSHPDAGSLSQSKRRRGASTGKLTFVNYFLRQY